MTASVPMVRANSLWPKRRKVMTVTSAAAAGIYQVVAEQNDAEKLVGLGEELREPDARRDDPSWRDASTDSG